MIKRWQHLVLLKTMRDSSLHLSCTFDYHQLNAPTMLFCQMQFIVYLIHVSVQKLPFKLFYHMLTNEFNRKLFDIYIFSNRWIPIHLNIHLNIRAAYNVWKLFISFWKWQHLFSWYTYPTKWYLTVLHFMKYTSSTCSHFHKMVIL